MAIDTLKEAITKAKRNIRWDTKEIEEHNKQINQLKGRVLTQRKRIIRLEETVNLLEREGDKS